MVKKTGPRQLFLFPAAGMVRMGNTRNCSTVATQKWTDNLILMTNGCLMKVEYF